MPIAFLFPDGQTDADSNIDSGALTDVDEGITGADAALETSIPNAWAGGGEITFTMDDLPAEATGINSVTLRVRAEIGGGLDDDLLDFEWDMNGGAGFNANTILWDETDDGVGLVNRTASVNSSATVSQVNAAVVRVRQTLYDQTKGPDGCFHAWDCFELEVDYDAADNNTAELPAQTLTLTPFAPDAVSTDKHIAVLPSATLTLAPFAPTVETFDPNIVQLPSQTLTLTPFAPTANVAANNTAELPSATFTLAPFAPDSVTTEKHIAVLPSAALTLAPFPPDAISTELNFADLPSVTLTLTPNAPQVVATENNFAVLPAAALTLAPFPPQAVTTEGVQYEQEGFRFRNDDGTEITASWRQLQDVDDIAQKEETVRLRALTATNADAPSITRTLQYKRDDEADSEYRTI